MTDHKKHELTLPGIDGSNPLGFLSALGAFRVIQNLAASLTFKWSRQDAWCPVIVNDVPIDEDDFLGKLLKGLESIRARKAFDIGEDLKLEPASFRSECEKAAENSSCDRREDVDLLASFGSDVIVDDKKKIRVTPFHLLSGNQKFLTIEPFAKLLEF